MQRESKSPLRAKRFSMSITHQRIQEERQEARHGSVTDCGANGRAFQGSVRFKSLEDLALDTRSSASGSGTRQRTRMSHAKREVGAACALLLVQRRSRDNRLVGRAVARVSVEEHMANYQAARALMGKGKSSVKKGARQTAARRTITPP